MMTPTGGPARLAAPGHREHDARQLLDQPADSSNHEKIYIEFDEFVQLKDQQKEFFTSPQMKKKPLVSLRGRGIVVQLRDTLEAEYDLCAQFRQRHPRQQRGQPALLDALCLLDGARDRLDGHVGLYGRQLQGRLRVEELHLVLPRRFGRERRRIRLDDLQVQAGCHRPRREQRHLHRPEPQADRLPRLCRPGQERQPDVRTRFRPGRLPRRYLQPRASIPDFAMWYDSIRQYVVAEPQLYLRMFTDKAFRRQVLSQSERPLQHKAMLYFARRAPADRAYPFRQHPRGSGHLRPADRRARHHRPVVQHAFVGTPRYDQGRDHLFQARYGQCPAIGHRAA